MTKKITHLQLKALLLPAMTLIFVSGCIHKDTNKVKTKIPKRVVTKKKNTPQKENPKKEEKKYFRDLDYDGHKRVKNKLLAEGRKEAAINHIEKMIPLCDDIRELRDLTLEIADLFFETGNLKKSESLYTEFGNLYPTLIG